LKKSSNVKNEEKPTEVEASIQYSKIETGVEQPSKKRKLEPKAALNKVSYSFHYFETLNFLLILSFSIGTSKTS